MKTIRFPYKKINNYILIKLIEYDTYKKYKKITYQYEKYINQELVLTNKHRNFKPAVVIYSNNKIVEYQFWEHGKLHRVYGPAIMRFVNKDFTQKEWYLNGVKLDGDELKTHQKIINRKLKMLKLIYNIKNKN